MRKRLMIHPREQKSKNYIMYIKIMIISFLW